MTSCSQKTALDVLAECAVEELKSATDAIPTLEDTNTSNALMSFPSPPPAIIPNEFGEPRLRTFTPKLVCPSCLEVKQRWFATEFNEVGCYFMDLITTTEGDTFWRSMVTECCNEFICNACQKKVAADEIHPSKNIKIMGHHEFATNRSYCVWHKRC